MNSYKKFIALAAVVLILTLTGCNLKASTPPPAAATTSAETPFPAETLDTVSQFATQTAIASQPQGQATETSAAPSPETPQTSAETSTPTAEQNTGGTGGETSGGTEKATSTPEPTKEQSSGGQSSSGGGQSSSGSSSTTTKPTPVIKRPATYTLEPGEFPFCIARRFDVDPGSLLSLNGLGANTLVAAGSSLKIPASGNWDTSAFGKRELVGHPTKYTVRAGDTLYTIACRYGDVAPESILAVNDLKGAGDIKTGMVLNIP